MLNLSRYRLSLEPWVRVRAVTDVIVLVCSDPRMPKGNNFRRKWRKVVKMPVKIMTRQQLVPGALISNVPSGRNAVAIVAECLGSCFVYSEGKRPTESLSRAKY